MRNYFTLRLLLIVFFFSLSFQLYAHDFIYVKQDAQGSNNGTSWANAYNNLQDAIAAASDDDTIFVAKGTYYPDLGSGYTSGDRNASFMLKHGIVLMGGYAGNEIFEKYESGDGLNNFRKYFSNWQVNKTILSGDLSGNDNSNISPDEPTRSENSIHILSSLSPLDTTAEINGFYISGGNANLNTPFQAARGGGMYISGSTMQIKNCLFENNTALESGGALFANSGALRIKFVTFTDNSAKTGGALSLIGTDDLNSPGKPLVVNCFFFNNTSSGNGAGIYAINGVDPYISNGVFAQNNSGTSGAGIYADNKSYPEVTNSTFYSNTAFTSGAGTTISGGRISNSIFRNNDAASGSQIFTGAAPANGSVTLTVIASIVQGGFAGSQIYDMDPMFKDAGNPKGSDNLFGTIDDGLALQSTSPVIDSGLTWVNVQKSDIAGFPRQSNNKADFGAYEYQRFNPDYVNLYKELQKGGYILLFRHGVTDMSQTDQNGYLENLENCSLQRNLSPQGIIDLEFISSATKLIDVPFDTSLTSPLCRTRETGRIITGSFKTSIAWMGADSNYKNQRITDLSSLTRDGLNSVISTHMNSIEDVTTVKRIEVQEGDAIVIKPLGGNNFEEIAHITTDTWEKIINYLPTGSTDVENDISGITSYYLADNYPNPFNPSTTIEFKTAAAGHVSLRVFDALGREVANLVDEYKNPGVYKIRFNAADLSSGVYFYSINTGDFIQTKKLMLIK